MHSTDNLSSDIWSKVFRINQDIVSRTIAGEYFLVPVRGKLADMQEIFALNPVAEFIWKELDGQKNLQDIRTNILLAFDVERGDAEPDIREFITELLEAKLIGEVI